MLMGDEWDFFNGEIKKNEILLTKISIKHLLETELFQPVVFPDSGLS